MLTGRRRWRLWAALCASVVAVAGVIGVEAAPASAATSTFTAVADTQIREASPALNYGTSTALRVDGGGDPDVQSFLGFSVTGLSGAVQSATLRVYATSTTANGPSVFTPAATWAESTLTWSNRPALVGDLVGSLRRHVARHGHRHVRSRPGRYVNRRCQLPVT